MNFQLDDRLLNDTIFIMDWPLSRVLLRNEKNFPWLILVPRRENIIELFELIELDQMQLTREIAFAAELMHKLFNADKMNIAAFGNVVPQLHVHIIVRYKMDLLWPKPAIGVEPVAYSEEEIISLKTKLYNSLKDFCDPK